MIAALRRLLSPRPRPREHLERELRPIRRWRIYAQVDTTTITALAMMRGRRWLVRELPEFESEAAGEGWTRENIGIAFVLSASAEEHAERAGRRRLERLGLEPATLRARPASRRAA